MRLVFKMCNYSFATSSKPANSPSVLTVNGYHISGTPVHQLDSGHMSLRKASGDPQVGFGEKAEQQYPRINESPLM